MGTTQGWVASHLTQPTQIHNAHNLTVCTVINCRTQQRPHTQMSVKFPLITMVKQTQNGLQKFEGTSPQ